MGAFGSISLANKFGIVLGCAILLTFVAGFIKLYINRRTLKKNTKKEELEAAASVNDEEKLVTRKLDAGDLFGVRALEAGYFGGVAQSRPSSLDPATSASSSVTDLRTTLDDSTASPTVAGPKTVKHGLSRLRLQPSDEELNERVGHDQPGADGNGGSYVPLVPSPGSKEGSPLPEGKPPSPTNKQRPQSYLPKLQFPVHPVERIAQLVPTPSGSALGVRSEAASIAGSDFSEHLGPQLKLQTGAPTFNFFPQQIPSRAARSSSQRSIFPISDAGEERPMSRRSQKDRTPIPPIPQGGFSSGIDTQRFKPDAADPGPFQNSFNNESAGESKLRSRAHSVAASSLYSATTSILDSSAQTPRNRSLSTSSHDLSRSNSTKSLGETQDSIQSHNRDRSEDNRRSRDSEVDRTRKSQFSNSNATSNHSASSSESSFDSRSIHDPYALSVPKSELFGLSVPGPGRLSGNVAARIRDSSATGRGRSASGASMNSIGDFYDAYYRNSIMMQRLSQVHAQGGDDDSAKSSLTTGKKPAPLTLGDGFGGVGETIVEMPSPALSPVVVSQERFSSRV